MLEKHKRSSLFLYNITDIDLSPNIAIILLLIIMVDNLWIFKFQQLFNQVPNMLCICFIKLLSFYN